MYEAWGSARPSRSILAPYLVVQIRRSAMQNLFQYCKKWKNQTSKLHIVKKKHTNLKQLLKKVDDHFCQYATEKNKIYKTWKIPPGQVHLLSCQVECKEDALFYSRFRWILTWQLDQIRTFGAFPQKLELRVLRVPSINCLAAMPHH